MTDKTITLHKGGTGEKEIKVSAIHVPDLWPVVIRLRKAKQTGDAQLVIDCWHLTHAMKDHLQQQKEPALPERIE